MSDARDELREAAAETSLRLKLDDDAERKLQARIDALTPVQFDALMEALRGATASGRTRQNVAGGVVQVLKIAAAVGLLG